MVRRRSQNAAVLNTLLDEAVHGVQSGKYNSSYKAAKELGLNKETVLRRVNGGLLRSQARQQQ